MARRAGRNLALEIQSILSPEAVSGAQMEMRYHEAQRAREIYERYVQCLPTVKAWVRYAKFEFSNAEVERARSCYERAVEELGGDGQTVRNIGQTISVSGSTFLGSIRA